MRRSIFPLSVLTLNLALAFALVGALGRDVMAQPKTSSEWFNIGDNHYNLGEFEKAIEAFRKAFELERDEALKPIYLYNIAQSYRQAGDCDNAVFFYKRFLSLKAADTKKPLAQSTKDDIQKRIAEQEKICADKNTNRDKPPEGTMRPDGNGKTGGKTGDEPEGKPGEETGAADKPGTKVADASPDGADGADGAGDEEDVPGGPGISDSLGARPRLLSLRVGAGLAIPKMSPVDASNQFAASIVGGYPLQLGPKLGVDVGVALGLAPLQWTDAAAATQTSMLITAVANAGLRFDVAPQVTLRADAGLGVLFFTNVGDNNPFTESGQAAEGGALTMLHVRAAAAAEYALTPQISLWASPLTFGYSPAKAGLMADSIIQLAFLAGAGYRM